MASFDVMEKSIEELQRAMQAGEVTSRQLVDLYLARIEAYDKQGPALNAIVAVNPRAREAADALDAERTGRALRGPLHGIPVLVKDNYETIEMPTTAGSIALASFHPAARRLPGAAAEGRRRRHSRQDEHARARGGDLDGRLALRADARTPTISIAIPAVRAAERAPRSRRTSRPPAWAATPADRSGFRRRTTISSACAARRGCPAAPASCRSRARRISAGRSRAPSPTWPSCSTRRSAPIRPTRRRRRAPGRFPPSYRAGLRADALKGARIGVVRSLFGTAPEDQEVTTVVQQALDGAEEGGRRGHRRRHPGPRRPAARQLDDQLRLQVRSGGVSRPSPRTRR